MGSLTSRGRALVVVAFLLSAALCGGSAVALVVASRHEAHTPAALAPAAATPAATETPTPTPSASPTPVFTVTPRPTVTATPAPTATATATASPAARTTSSPRASHSTAPPAGLALDAILDPANGTSPGQDVGLFAHATDGDGTIRLVSVTWGDGTKSTAGKVTECASTGKGDCKDFVLHHTYAASGTFTVTITVASAGTLPETSSLTLKEFVNGPSPAASPASG